MSSNIHESLSTALLEAHSIPAIEKQLAQSLAEVGWTSDLRTYIQRLVRNGEAGNYQAILKKVLAEVKASSSSNGEVNGAKRDGSASDGVGDLTIPEKVVRDGVKVVRKELERVVTVVVDD